MKRFTALLLVLLFSVALHAQDRPFFFIQATDPQFGMYTANGDLAQETANFEFLIASANRLKPAFLIVTGDLVNRAGDKEQAAEYLRIARKLDRSIRLYNVAGNHDVGNTPTPESIAAYTKLFGPDHYAFRSGSLAGFVLNSTLIHDPSRAPRQMEDQETWLVKELQKARAEGARHLVVFLHHPLFIERPDEPARYENFPLEARRRYLDIFHKYGVKLVFAGHYHGNAVASDGDVQVITNAPIGKPLRQEPSGLRIVVVRESGLEQRYYSMGDVPNQVDLQKPLPASR